MTKRGAGLWCTGVAVVLWQRGGDQLAAYGHLCHDQPLLAPPLLFPLRRYPPSYRGGFRVDTISLAPKEVRAGPHISTSSTTQSLQYTLRRDQ